MMKEKIHIRPSTILYCPSSFAVTSLLKPKARLIAPTLITCFTYSLHQDQFPAGIIIASSTIRINTKSTIGK